MAFKKETLQTNRQIKVCLDKETDEALRNSADRRKEQHSVLGRMIIISSLKALRDTNAPIAHALQVAAEMATGIPEYLKCEVKVRLTTEKFKEWRADGVKINRTQRKRIRVRLK